MTDDNKLGLSRRNVLGGIGIVGLACAGAGMGTTAFFNDEESFTNNQLNAGELDLAVHATVYEYQEMANNYGQSFDTIIDSGDDVKQELVDVKPGDYSWGRFCFSVVDNPAYIWAGGELTANNENTVTEPEADSDDENNAETDTEIDGDGELADAIEACLFYVPSDNYDPSTQGRPSDVGAPGTVLFEGSLREILAALQTGIPLDSSDEDGRQAFSGDDEVSFDADDQCLGFCWEVPTDVENEIQTDSLTFDLSFYAEQERHNDGSNNPFADVVLQSDATGGIRETDNWITASVSAGPTTVIKIELDGEVYGGGNSGTGEWPNNQDVYFFEANIDIDNDGVDEAANDDDFRVGFAAANSGARAGGISNSSSGASGNGGYIRRNTGDSNAGDNADRTDIAEEDVPGFFAYESDDKLTYTLVIDWPSITNDSNSPTAQLSSVPTAIQINEIFGSDGGEGVAATPNNSNDGREDIDNVTDSSGTLTL